ncbi:MAG: hypothetical protein Q4G59_11005, partial [Planctomycetia bacterium]|nr:hypothetical protein [Planctomycetia bacterium]
FYLDRIQLEKTLAFPITSVCEETITRFYRKACNLRIEEHEKTVAVAQVEPLPEELTSVYRSPGGTRWIGWQSNPVFDAETSKFSNQGAVYLSLDPETKTALQLPFNIPLHAACDCSETRIALAGKPNDSIKLVLYHLPTSSQVTIDDFGGSRPLCFGRLFFSPDGQYLYAEGINRQAFIFDTKQGKRVGGPFVVSGSCHGNPWSVSPQGVVFLNENTLFLFRPIDGNTYTLIRFAAKPDRLFFHQDFCSVVISDHVWVYDGHTGMLAAPLFKMDSIENIRIEANRNIIFSLKDREETWQWQYPYSQSQMIPAKIQQVRSIDIAPDGTVWILHDDKQLTVIDRKTAKQDTFSNVVYAWPSSGSFLINDGKYRRPQIGNISGEKRFCNFELPFAERIQGEKTGKYLLVTSCIGPGTFPGFGQTSGRTLTCYHLQKEESVWQCSDLKENARVQFADDLQKTILSLPTGSFIVFDNETGEHVRSNELPDNLAVEQRSESPVQNGYYQSEQIVCDYYDQERDWFWLSTTTGRVFTLDRKTLLPTVVTYQFNSPVQAINVTKSQSLALAIPGFVFVSEL